MQKILLVEDDAPLLDVMRYLLEAEGYEVCPAVNGKQALELFVSSRPSLVISDIMMPEMNGYELLEAVRDHAGRDYRTVSVSKRPNGKIGC